MSVHKAGDPGSNSGSGENFSLTLRTLWKVNFDVCLDVFYLALEWLAWGRHRQEASGSMPGKILTGTCFVWEVRGLALSWPSATSAAPWVLRRPLPLLVWVVRPSSAASSSVCYATVDTKLGSFQTKVYKFIHAAPSHIINQNSQEINKSICTTNHAENVIKHNAIFLSFLVFSTLETLVT